MKYRQEIIEAIHLGLRRGYNKKLEFLNKWTSFESKMTEYLLTVNVAYELNDFRNYKKVVAIELEYPLFEFYNNAFPQAIWTNEDQLFAENKYLSREFEMGNSRKRMDIAIMENQRIGLLENYRSIHGVEVKAINSRYDLIIKDVNRLAHSMLCLVDVTDKTSILSCYSAFVKSYNNGLKPTSKSEITIHKERIKQQVESNLDRHIRCKHEYSHLDFIVYFNDIDCTSFEEYYDNNKHIPDFELGWDPDNETGSILGVVIEIIYKL